MQGSYSNDDRPRQKHWSILCSGSENTKFRCNVWTGLEEEPTNSKLEITSFFVVALHLHDQRALSTLKVRKKKKNMRNFLRYGCAYHKSYIHSLSLVCFQYDQLKMRKAQKQKKKYCELATTYVIYSQYRRSHELFTRITCTAHTSNAWCIREPNHL